MRSAPRSGDRGSSPERTGKVGAVGGAVVAALLAVIAWGASFVATRVALEGFTPAGLVAARLLIGTIFLLALLRLRGGPLLPARADRPRCLLLGVVFSAHLLIQAEGLRYTTAINTGWIIAFIPVTIALGAHLFLGQSMRKVGWLGASLASAGVLLVTRVRLADFEHAGVGDLLQLASCLTWTFYTLAGIAPVARSGALRVTAFTMAVAALPAALLAAGTGRLHRPPGPYQLGSVAFLGVACSGAALVLWLYAQKRLGPTRTGGFLYLEPFVTLAVSAALLAEPLTLPTLLGGLIVLGGVRLVALGSPR